MKLNLKGLIKAPPAEGYIKNSSLLVTSLFIIGGILYKITGGYGTIIALSVALIVMIGQKLLIDQANGDFRDMYFSRDMYLKTDNVEYLEFIEARSSQMLRDNKVLSEKAKREIEVLKNFVKEKRK